LKEINKMNVVLVILDTLRQDHVGCYGNDWIKTPYLDQLARDSVVFTRGYPESLPTLQVRRALHTGCRVFPFPNHLDYRGNQFLGNLGWGPICEERDTLAELLQERGYRTGFVTDAYHQFKPHKNFHRGFDEWNWIRGQENDPYRSGPKPSWEEVARYVPEQFRDKGMENLRIQDREGGQTRKNYMDFVRDYLTNVQDRHLEED
jgi:arylsulfatase A-like enzyme